MGHRVVRRLHHLDCRRDRLLPRRIRRADEDARLSATVSRTCFRVFCLHGNYGRAPTRNSRNTALMVESRRDGRRSHPDSTHTALPGASTWTD
jgi:hypothetical protein